MRVTILNPKHVLYEGKAQSVFLPGDRSEFEILDHHAPISSLLTAGEVVIDWQKRVRITKGMIKFDNNECMILVEE